MVEAEVKKGRIQLVRLPRLLTSRLNRSFNSGAQPNARCRCAQRCRRRPRNSSSRGQRRRGRPLTLPCQSKFPVLPSPSLPSSLALTSANTLPSSSTATASHRLRRWIRRPSDRRCSDHIMPAYAATSMFFPRNSIHQCFFLLVMFSSYFCVRNSGANFKATP